MNAQRIWCKSILAASILTGTTFATSPSGAVPAFAEQTGLRCQSCHVGGLGPQLTPFGRNFKVNGFTMRAGNTFTLPVSAMAIASFVNTASDQPSPPADHYGTNNNFTLDEASIFIAGGFGEHFGAFSQFTYDGVGRAFGWDNLDVRAVDHLTFGGSDVLVGVDLNNNPGIQDPFNTLPAWGFPYTNSDLAPGPAAATLFDGGYELAVLGTTAYAQFENGLYAEAGFYFTPGQHFLSAFGTDEGPGQIDGVAPYLRMAWQKDLADGGNLQLGAFGFFPSFFPGNDRTAGRTDSYSDLGVDVSYQLSDSGTNVYSVNARYTHEEQDLAATHLLGGSLRGSNSLDDFRIDGSYYWRDWLGLTVQLFDTEGSRDPLLYAGNRTFSPDSNGVRFQVDATPWGEDVSPFGPRFNMRVGLQYTIYSKFDGASRNYDGSGHDAADNNTLRIFTWFAL
jgi:hypothetical protein